jgi:hypothetical protein
MTDTQEHVQHTIDRPWMILRGWGDNPHNSPIAKATRFTPARAYYGAAGNFRKLIDVLGEFATEDEAQQARQRAREAWDERDLQIDALHEARRAAERALREAINERQDVARRLMASNAVYGRNALTSITCA